MSLLAGLKFVKKTAKGPTSGGAGKQPGSWSTVNQDYDRGNDGGEHKHGSSKKHHKKGKKEKQDKDSSNRRDTADGPTFKRRKTDGNEDRTPAKMIGPGGAGAVDRVDWVDQAFNFSGQKKGHGDGNEGTAGEIADRKREEEIDREVVDGKRDPKTKRRYGLYDPLKGDADTAPPAEGGGNGGGLSTGSGGLPGTFPPPVKTGVGDKGAGWRAKALKRAREKAETSGQSLEELVGERWGSLEQLERDARGASVGGCGGPGRGRGFGYRKGREELASFAASEGRIAPEDEGGLVGQVGRAGGLEHGGGRERERDRGGRGGRLRIGRDAKDTDVLKRFSSKLEDALGRNDETKRSIGRSPHEHDSREPHSSGRGDERGHREDGERERPRNRPERGRENVEGGRSSIGWTSNPEGMAEGDSGRRRSRGHAEREGDDGSQGGTNDGGWREREARRDEAGSRGWDYRRGGLGNGKKREDEDKKGREGERHNRDSGDRKMRFPETSRRDEARGDREAAQASHEVVDRPTKPGREEPHGGGGRNGRLDGDRNRRERDDSRPHQSTGTSDKQNGRDEDHVRASDDMERSDSRGNSRDFRKTTSAYRDGCEEDRSSAGKDREEGKPSEQPTEVHNTDDVPIDEEGARSTGESRRQSESSVTAEHEAPVAKELGKEKGTKVVVVGEQLTDAEFTRLAVSMMKAKLKGDMAEHARLAEKVRAGREAAAAAAAVETAAAHPDSQTPSVKWKPGQDVEDTPSQGRLGSRTRSAVVGVKGRKKDGADERDGEKSNDDEEEDEEKEEVEIVTTFDDRGRPVRAAAAPLMREDLRTGSRKGKLKNAGGRWAEHGDESVADFVRREREQGFEDMDETFLRNVSRLGNKFRGTELVGAHTGLAGEDEEEEVDMRMFQRPEDRMTAVAAAERQKSKAIAEHRRQSQATSRCHLCMEAPGFKKRLVLSLGEHTFLYLATGARKLSEGHCYIVPIRHTPASTACDEDVWREIDLFKSCLRRMSAEPTLSTSATTAALADGDDVNSKQSRKNSKKARQGGGGVVFLETGGKPGSSAARHAFIEAVPLHKNAFLDAPMYFRQALLDAGDEWSTHKKCIPADPRRGGVRRAVPKGFPYFHVEWDDGGYAQVIEGEESKFPRDFGVDTIAGVLGVDPPSFGGRGRERGGLGRSGGHGGAGEDEERRMVMAFLDKWKPFDWTAELDGGEYHADATSAA